MHKVIKAMTILMIPLLLYVTASFCIKPDIALLRHVGYTPLHVKVKLHSECDRFDGSMADVIWP